MENLNAEQIKNALECCATTSEGDCIKCGYRGKKRSTFITCTNCLISDALALINSQEQRIKELTEENERLRGENKALVNDNAEMKNQIQEEISEEDLNLYDEFTKLLTEGIKEAKANTVRKMQERIKQYIDVGHYRSPTEICFSELDVANIIDRIAKEMLEGEK